MDNWNWKPLIMKFVILLIFISVSVNGDCNSSHSYFDEVETVIKHISKNETSQCSILDCHTFNCSGIFENKVWSPKYNFEIHLDCAAEKDAQLHLSGTISSVEYNQSFSFDFKKGYYAFLLRVQLPGSNNYTITLNVVNTITHIANGSIQVTSGVTIITPERKWDFKPTGIVSNLKCSPKPTQPATTSPSTVQTTVTKKPTTTAETATKATPTPTPTTPSTTVQTTSKPPTTEATTAPATTTTTTTNSTTTNTTSTKSSFTTKVETNNSSNNSHSKPARIVLIVLAILIVIAVIGIYIYFKRKRRLSDQPAYYNDIAINDPLRSELYEEEEIHGGRDANDDDDDDDELPLFA